VKIKTDAKIYKLQKGYINIQLIAVAKGHPIKSAYLVRLHDR